MCTEDEPDLTDEAESDMDAFEDEAAALSSYLDGHTLEDDTELVGGHDLHVECDDLLWAEGEEEGAGGELARHAEQSLAHEGQAYAEWLAELMENAPDESSD